MSVSSIVSREKPYHGVFYAELSYLDQGVFENMLAKAPIRASCHSWRWLCDKYMDVFDCNQLSEVIYALATKVSRMGKNAREKTLFVNQRTVNALLIRIHEMVRASVAHPFFFHLGESHCLIKAYSTLDLLKNAGFPSGYVDKIQFYTRVRIGQYPPSILIDAVRVSDTMDISSQPCLNMLDEIVVCKKDGFSISQLCYLAKTYQSVSLLMDIGQTIANKAKTDSSEFTPDFLVAILSSYADAGLLGRELILALVELISQKIEEFSFSQTIALSHALVRLGIPIGPIVTQRIKEHVQKSKEFDLDAVIKLLYVLVKEGIYDTCLNLKLQQMLCAYEKPFTCKQAALIIWAFSFLECGDVCTLFHYIRKSLCLEECSRDDLVRIAYGFVNAGIIDVDFFAEIRLRALDILDRFACLHLYIIIDTFTVVNLGHPYFFRKLANRVVYLKDRFKPQHLKHVVSCYERCGYGSMLAVVKGSKLQELCPFLTKV